MQVERNGDGVELFAARNPLSPHLVRDVAPGDLTIAQLIAHAVDLGAFGPIGTAAEVEAVKDELRDLRVYVDGQALPFATPEDQARTLDLVVPPGGVVNLQVEPLGGSNGTARSLVNIFYQIGAVIASAAFGPLVGALVSISGNLVSNALFPIKKPDSLPSANDAGALNSQSNSIRIRGMMPLQLGAERVAGDVAANAYSTNRNGDVWLTVIFGWHYGPASLADLKIGETLLADYPAGDVQVVHHLTPGPRTFSLYANSPHQENLQDKLTLGGPGASGAEWEVYTTQLECDRVDVDITWPQGLRFNKPNGSILNQEIRVQIQWAPVGTDDWADVPLEGAPYYSRLGAVLPTGVYEQAACTQDPVRRTLAWTKGNSNQIKIQVRAWDPDGDDATKCVQDTYVTALRSVAFKTPISDQYLAITELSIKSSDDLGGTLPTVTAVITPHAPHWTGTAWQDDIADWTPTSNMAALTRMLFMGPGAPEPYTAEDFDASCEDAYELIEANGWTGAYRLDGEVTQEDALLVLGVIGRFSGYDVGEGLCFVSDWEKPVARQIFNASTVENYTLTRIFPKPVHAVLVEFKNIGKDSKADELTVYADGFDSSTADLIETYRLDWSCTMARAFKEGRAWLARRQLGVETHTWTSGPQAIASSYGARVRVSHPTALYGQVGARVQFRHMAGGLVTGVRLSDEVEMVTGETYALDVQRTDLVLFGLAVTNTPGRTRDVMFPVGLTEAAAPMAGDEVTFGRQGLVSEDVEIVDFEPDGDDVKITARRYLGVELEAAETGPIPSLTSKLTATPKAPKPRLLGIVQATPDAVKVAFDVDSVRGALVDSFPVRWRRSADPANPWNTLQPLAASARVASTPAILDAANPTGDSEGAFAVDIEIRSKLRSGDLSDALVVEAIQIGRTVAPPTNISVLGAVRSDSDDSTYPVLFVAADAVTSGLVVDLVVQAKIHGAADSTYRSAGEPLLASNPKGDYTSISGGRTYDVRLAWRTYDGWLSAWTVVASVPVPAGSRVASDTVKAGGRPIGSVLSDITNNTVATAANSLSYTVFNGETLERLDQIQNDTNGNKTFITDFRSIDGDGVGKAVFTIDANGHAGGFVAMNDGSVFSMYFVVDEFGVVGTDGVGRKVFLVDTVTGEVKFRANVAIDGNLTITGTLTTRTLANNSVTIPLVTTGSSTINCDGTDKVIISHTVDLTDDATLFVSCFLSSHFPSGDKNWNAVLYIDGVPVYTTGGANGEANMPLGGALPCSAGEVDVVVTLNSHSSVNITSRTLSSLGPMR